MKTISRFPYLFLTTFFALGLMTCVVSAQFPLPVPTRITTFPLARPHQSGKVIAWGNNDISQTNVPTTVTNAVSVAAGNDFCLALKDDGTVIGWGSNTHGQATPPTNLTNVVAIAAGAQHGVALRADGSVVCWGDNSVGQTDVPLGITNAVAVSTKWLHSLALLSDGTVVGWGANGEGESTPPTNLSNVVSISAGWVHSMALRSDGTVAVWGSNYWEQSNVPQNLSNAVAIADCGTTSFALLADGTVVGWGRNSDWPIVPPPPITQATSIVTGYVHVYATLADGTFQSWGFNGDGVLNLPSQINSDDILALGGRHNLAIRILSPSGDEDGDGVTNFREEKDGTNPDDPSSFNPLSKGLVAYYPFDGNANDESGYGNNGTTTSATFAPDRFGVDSSAISFAQDPSYVTTEVGALPVGAQSRTISFWARPNTLPISLMPAAVSYGTTTSGGNAFGIGIGADANPYFWGHGVDIDVVGSSTINQRQWVQLVASLDGSGTLSLFQDGQLVARKPNSGLNTTSAGLLIGRWLLQNVEGFTCQFDGVIDQLRVYSRAFSESEVAQLFYAEAFTTAERSFITSNPSLIGHYSQAEYQLNRTNGQIDVTTNPSGFNLFTQEQFNNNRTAGQSDVINNPMSYGLYTSNSIMDLRMGGLMIQRQGTNATISFQPQTTTDLTQPFTNNGASITHEVPMPGNKGFIRINAKP